MTLYVLKSSQFSALFGTSEAPLLKSDVTIIGQTEDCGAFLVLSDTAYPELDLQTSIPPEFIFTYCQQWGLSITAEVIRRVKKELRTGRVASIVVTTTSGKVFNGDEASQSRMARAIVGMQAANATTITWTLADNTVVNVTLVELTEAMILAGQQQSQLWPLE